MVCDENNFEGVTSSDSNADHCILITGLLDPVLTCNGDRNCHTLDLVEHTRLLFSKVPYSRHDVPPEVF
jgi:hypothetical protein